MKINVSMPHNTEVMEVKVAEHLICGEPQLLVQMVQMDEGSKYSSSHLEIWMDPALASALYNALARSVQADKDRRFDEFVREGQDYDAFIGAAEGGDNAKSSA